MRKVGFKSVACWATWRAVNATRCEKLERLLPRAISSVNPNLTTMRIALTLPDVGPGSPDTLGLAKRVCRTAAGSFQK